MSACPNPACHDGAVWIDGNYIAECEHPCHLPGNAKYEYRVVTRHGWERGDLDEPRVGTWRTPTRTWGFVEDAERMRAAWDEAPRFPDDVPHRVERRRLGEWEADHD